jgi:hypothetical protein
MLVAGGSPINVNNAPYRATEGLYARGNVFTNRVLVPSGRIGVLGV